MHDTHVHLDMLLEKLESSRELRLDLESKLRLEKLLENHEFAIQSTVSWQNFEQAWRLFEILPKVKFLCGSHPELVDSDFNLSKYLQEQNAFWQKFQKTLSGSIDSTQNIPSSNQKWSKLVGVGEIGLDYFYTQDDGLIQAQQKLFESQLALSLEITRVKQKSEFLTSHLRTLDLENNWQDGRELNPSQTLINLELIQKLSTDSEKNLPVVIHCRAAFSDLLAILQDFPAVHHNFLIHCFTGNIEDLRKTLDLGGLVAFGGILTYKNTQSLRLAAKFCPMDNLVLETDLPFLSPQSRRGQVCLPEFISETASTLAQIKEVSVAKIWQSSLQNTQRLFNF